MKKTLAILSALSIMGVAGSALADSDSAQQTLSINVNPLVDLQFQDASVDFNVHTASASRNGVSQYTGYKLFHNSDGFKKITLHLSEDMPDGTNLQLSLAGTPPEGGWGHGPLTLSTATVTAVDQIPNQDGTADWSVMGYTFYAGSSTTHSFSRVATYTLVNQ